jgi:hypothetical protein
VFLFEAATQRGLPDVEPAAIEAPLEAGAEPAVEVADSAVEASGAPDGDTVEAPITVEAPSDDAGAASVSDGGEVAAQPDSEDLLPESSPTVSHEHD